MIFNVKPFQIKANRESLSFISILSPLLNKVIFVAHTTPIRNVKIELWYSGIFKLFNHNIYIRLI